MKIQRNIIVSSKYITEFETRLNEVCSMYKSNNLNVQYSSTTGSYNMIEYSALVTVYENEPETEKQVKKLL